MNEPAGWYYAEGDEAGSTRYWDGSQWQSEAQEAPATESVSELALVAPGVRLLGRLIDWLLLSIVILPVLMAAQTDGAGLILGVTYKWLAGIGVALFIWDTLWIGLVGATPGKLILGYRVSAVEGGESPTGLQVAALRAANRLVLLIPAVGEILWLGVGLVSLGMMFNSDEHQSVMDKAADTVVAATPK